MKRIILFLTLGISIVMQVMAQRPVIGVLDINVDGLEYKPSDVGNIARREMEKLDTFQVIDRFDVMYMAQQNKLELANCYGKMCLVELGKKLGANKMLTGSAERYGETIIITLRIVDVNQNNIEKTLVKEFLDLPSALPQMISVAVRELMGKSVSPAELAPLTRTPEFTENALNSANVDRLRLSGVRMGFVYLTGTNAEIFRAPTSQGGFDIFPMMYQLGYQFETTYLNEGNFQALFEFIPMVTGVEHGLFIPSFTVLHGMRLNRKGWEFAVGPSISFSRQAEGYTDATGAWKLKTEWDGVGTRPEFVTRLDSRGDAMVNPGLVFAAGRSFISGKVNFPVNFYYIPNQNGGRIGFSMGFNSRRKKA